MKIYKFPLFKFLTLIILPAFTQQVYAQDSTRVLQLNDLIVQATANNKNIQLAKMDEQIAASNYKQTQAIFLPQVGISYTAFTSDNPLNAFGFKLQQQSISEADFNPALLNNPSATPDFMTQLTVQQPLVNMDLLYSRKSALKQTELYRYKTQRTKEQIIYQSRQAYLQLQLAYDAQKVLQESLLTTKSMYKFTNDRYVQGLLQKSDLLNVEVQIKTIETNLAELKSNIRNASDYLSLMMNKPTGVVYSVETPISSIDKRLAVDTLSANRSDFRAMETAIESAGLMIKSSKMSFLPKLNAFGNYQLHDKSMLGFGSGAYLAGVQLSWDIFKGNSTKNKIAIQILERNKMAEQLTNQKEESRVELNKTHRQFEDAAFKIQQHQAAVDQANEALRILQNRYQQGLVNTTDVLTAQTQLSQQKQAYTQAVFSRNVSLAYLEFLTSVNQ